MSTSYVALLRGINVGGKHSLPMKDLCQMFAAAGCDQVKNYIQSGNVVFRADADLAARIPDLITAEIEAHFGHRTPLLLRNKAQLDGVIRNNPFLKAGAAEETLYVLFLADRPGTREVAGLDPDRSPPDAFAVRGQEIYLRLPHGGARSKLINAYFDSKLRTISTARNWRSVNKLFQMLPG